MDHRAGVLPDDAPGGLRVGPCHLFAPRAASPCRGAGRAGRRSLSPSCSCAPGGALVRAAAGGRTDHPLAPARPHRDGGSAVLRAVQREPDDPALVRVIARWRRAISTLRRIESGQSRSAWSPIRRWSSPTSTCPTRRAGGRSGSRCSSWPRLAPHWSSVARAAHSRSHVAGGASPYRTVRRRGGSLLLPCPLRCSSA